MTPLESFPARYMAGYVFQCNKILLKVVTAAVQLLPFSRNFYSLNEVYWCIFLCFFSLSNRMFNI